MASAVETATAPAGPPHAPKDVAAEAGEAEVTLTWSAPDNDGGAAVVGYKIEQSTDFPTEEWDEAVANTGDAATQRTIRELAGRPAAEVRGARCCILYIAVYCDVRVYIAVHC